MLTQKITRRDQNSNFLYIITNAKFLKTSFLFIITNAKF